MQTRKIIILANGEVGNISFYKKYFTGRPYIVCANGGLKLAQKLRIKPDLVIGDFDSVPKGLLNKFIDAKTIFKKFSKEKDKSDLHLALDEAISKKPAEIIIIGALGGKIDQTLTNIFLLLRALNKKIPAKIVSAKYELFLIKKVCTIKNKKGDKVTFLSLAPQSSGVSLSGFKYLLSDADLLQNESRGLSNIITANLAKVSVKKGILLAVLSN